MAKNENKAEAMASAPKDERVAIFVPRESGNTDPNLIIVINGKNYILPKGQKSVVPVVVAEEYERAQRAQHKANNAMYDMVEQAREQAKAAGIK